MVWLRFLTVFLVVAAHVKADQSDDSTMGNIAQRWRELSGQNHWNGLLDPLDKDMRQYLLHYGNMEQATYDTYIKQNFVGSSGFPMSNPLSGAGEMSNNQPLTKYNVTKYLYATSAGGEMIQASNPLSKESNWMGYVAVATDEGKKVLGRRDIVVAWRGTIKTEEWAKDFESQMAAAPILNSTDNPKVHQGFYSVYTAKSTASENTKTSARDQATAEVLRLVEQYKNDELSITVLGHSLGAAIATLTAADFVANGLKKGVLVTAFAYASPRVGDNQFKQTLDKMGADTTSSTDASMLRVLRIVNKPDPVCETPPPIAGFTHVGQAYNIDTSMSLQSTANVAGAHDMKSYIQGIAGSQGNQKEGGLGGLGGLGQLGGLGGQGGQYGFNPGYASPANWWTGN